MIYFFLRLNLKVPNFSNPADFYIDALGLDTFNETESRAQIKVSSCFKWLK